jgi:hypothetical protein
MNVPQSFGQQDKGDAGTTTASSNARTLDLRDVLSSSFPNSQHLEAISWRIPESGESHKIGWRPLIFAFIVCTLTVFFLPAHMVPLSIVGAGILCVVLYFKERAAFVRWRTRPPNVWIDRDGLRFRTTSGAEFTLPIPRYFWIGVDPQTVRETKALVLLFEGDLVSQPVEIHPAHCEGLVRAFLMSAWQVPQSQHLPEPKEVEVPVDLQIDDHKQILRVAGSATGLSKACEALSTFGSMSTLPPVATRAPSVRFHHASGEVALQVSEGSWIDAENIGGPPEFFDQLSRLIQDTQQQADETAPASSEPFATSTGHRWKVQVTKLKD